MYIYTALISGVLTPLYGIFLILVSSESTDRELWCTLLNTSRITIALLFNHTFFFSFLFRTVLIRFANRGLVDKGRPNTGLFNKLYWTILLTFCCHAILMNPLISIIRGRYQKSLFVKICLLRPHKNDDFMYQKLGPMISGVFIPMFVCKYLNFKSLRFIRGICPNNRMSSIGNYRRNFLTLEDTCDFFLYFSLWECCNSLLMNFTYINQIFLLSPSVVAAIQNLSNFIFYGFFYGFVLPIRMSIPWNPPNKSKDTCPFYVGQEKVEPRRPLVISREEDYHRNNLAMSTSSRGKIGPTTKKKSKVKYSFESYNKTAPLSEQVCLCNECGYTCQKEITLKKHFNTKHQEVKKYSDNQEFSSELKNTDTLITVVTMDTVTCSCSEEVICDKCLDKWVSKETQTID